MADDGAERTAYMAASATESMRATPRFNHPRDFSLLFSSDQNEAKDYAVGLIFGACMILGLFLAWAIVLLLFKCMGETKVGFLSGAPLKQSPDKMNSRRPFRIRMVFLSAALLFITFTILLVTNGITNLQDTVTTVVNANSEIQQLERDASSIVESLASLAAPTRDIRSELIKLNTGEFCPDDPSLAQDTGVDFDKLIDDSIITTEKLGDFLAGDLNELKRALKSADEATMEIESHAEKIELNDRQALVFIVPYVMIPSFLLVALMMAWFDAESPTYTCVVQWFFLPLFVFITTVAFLLGAFVLMGAVANADFCSGESADPRVSPNPDETVLSILKTSGAVEDDLVFEIATFYVRQCTSEDPFGFIDEYREEIQTADDQLRSLTEAMEGVTIAKLNLACGRDFSPVESLLSSMVTNLNILRDNALAALELLRCSRIVPIYTSTVYSGTCTYSVTGVTWLFSCSLVVGFMGMLMIMFRSAMWEETYDDDERTPREEEEEVDDYTRDGAYQPEYVSDWKDEQDDPRVSRSMTRSSRSQSYGSQGSYSDPSYEDRTALY